MLLDNIITKSPQDKNETDLMGTRRDVSENQPRKKRGKTHLVPDIVCKVKKARSGAQLGKGPVSGDDFQTESGTS
jgi:hypothetical protein